MSGGQSVHKMENAMTDGARQEDGGPADMRKGDWVVFDLRVGQITDIRDYGQEFSDGVIRTSGRLAERFRPLTLRNKVIAETFDYYYTQLREIDGEIGFNYPDISSYFSALALKAIDTGAEGEGKAYDKAKSFVEAARKYQAVIDGIPLFRPSRRARAKTSEG